MKYLVTETKQIKRDQKTPDEACEKSAKKLQYFFVVIPGESTMEAVKV